MRADPEPPCCPNSGATTPGEDIARRLLVGMTSINDALVFSMNPALPFGGRGDSGYGRKHGGELREFAYPHSSSGQDRPCSALSLEP
ncbi:aldehyde dehydrogenase family protein [Nonomuraea sp. NPDC004186]